MPTRLNNNNAVAAGSSSRDAAATRSEKRTKSSTTKSMAPPKPPKTASAIQLQMWLAILQRRKQKIQQLSLASSHHFTSFVNDMISDLSSTRYETNEFSMRGGNKENSVQKEDADGSNNNRRVDLLAGEYSSFLLLTQQSSSSSSPPSTTHVSTDEIAIHLLALFYRSVDQGLPPSIRKHGLGKHWL
jgi:hypothetical protein